jgi:hypothetical protein
MKVRERAYPQTTLRSIFSFSAGLLLLAPSPERKNVHRGGYAHAN